MRRSRGDVRHVRHARRARRTVSLRAPGVVCALAAGVGCSGSAPPGASAVPAQVAAIDVAAPAYASPARWGYHPAAPSGTTAALRLPDGTCVGVAESGQRWSVAPAESVSTPEDEDVDVCAGVGTPSRYLAPEPLVGLSRRSASAFWFFGRSHTVYEAATPLGPFVRTIPPPLPLRRISGSGSTLLAVTEEGGLLRLDEGEGAWKEAALPSPAKAASPAGAGAAGASFWAFDVVAGEGGRALALAVPEALFHSTDGGVTWARAPVGPEGLWRVGALQGGELLAEGALRSVAWEPRRAAAFTKVGVGLPPALSAVPQAKPMPSATAVHMGRGVVTGVRYLEIGRPEEHEGSWSLMGGTFEGPLSVRALPGTESCGSIKVGAAGKNVAAVCVKGEDDLILAEVLRSDDGGVKWSMAARLTTPHVDGLGVAVSPEGAVLVTGACKPGSSESEGGDEEPDLLGSGSPVGRGGDETCRPTAPVLIRMEGDRPVVTLAAAPTLGSYAALPTFSVDGRSAYFVGERSKDERLALFVSHDGGETFAPRLLVQEEGSAGAAAGAAERDGPVPEPEDEEEHEEREETGGFTVSEESALVPAEDGAVGLVLGRDGRQVVLVTDEDGRIQSTGSPPAEGAMVGVAGRRALAVAVEARQERGLDAAVLAWESLDGGGSWAELPIAPAILQDAGGVLSVACSVAGCLVGDVVTRVGWSGQAEAPLPPSPEPARTEPAVRTPVACELDRGGTWTRVEYAVAGAWGMPSANELMRGRAVWSVLTREPTGAIATVAALLPEASPRGAGGAGSAGSAGSGEAKIVTRPLFTAPGKGTRTALDVSFQMEGYAAARVRLPGSPKTPIPDGTPMRNVEIAWENWIEGTSGRVTLPDAGMVDTGDVVPAAGDAYDPELLSVSVRGIFVRPHTEGADTFFIEPGGRGKLQRFDYPTWPAGVNGRALRVGSDAVFADGRALGVGMLQLNESAAITTVLLAHRDGAAGSVTSSGGAASAGGGSLDAVQTGPWTIHAATVTPPLSGPGLLGMTDWSYAGGVIGVTTLLSHPARGRGWAVFQAFQGDGTLGAPRALPTPWDLPAAPKPCSASERASTARLEAPMFAGAEPLFPGTRHPVTVIDTASMGGTGGTGGTGGLTQPLTLLTSSVVLQGTKAAPCVSGWEARPLGDARVMALLTGDLAHSWLFRAIAGSDRNAFEVRPMSCRFEAAAKVPDGVWSEPGTSRASR
ncbi:hypothetical protein [Chondromyces apiculatus]|uniref:Uncharacterized protein n=1 Tax=Chondromyces apiculatus DSM 436 TaxID=1192034 RepID=A0A017T1J5_9BACT|nr:hypothetical protein [Chondromyces apiculatus]EYF02431.1 Hypothetical protein CAP_7202 [Chondromyces apiculatus DSM 436]